MKKNLWAIALSAATLPVLALPAQASEPLDPRALSLGGHYTAYANADVNGTLGNPALLQYQRGFLYIGPNLGLSLGNNAVGVNDIGSLVGYGQYMQSYYQYATAGGTNPGEKELPDSLKTLKNDGLTIDLGVRSGLFGIKFPVPSFFGVRLPVDPPKPVKVKAVETKAPSTGMTASERMVTSKGTGMVTSAGAASASVAATAASASVAAIPASASVATMDASASTLVATAGASASTPVAAEPSPDRNLWKAPAPSVGKVHAVAPAQGGLAWGAMGARVWADAGADLSFSAPALFGVVTNFPNLDLELQSEIAKLRSDLEQNDVNAQTVGGDVNTIRKTITGDNGFGVFIAKDSSDSGKRSLTIGETNRAYATAGFTLTQPVPFPSTAWFPRAHATVGGTFKVFGGPGTLPSQYNPLPVASGADKPAIGAPGTLTIESSINLSQPLKDLDTALDEFSKDYSKANEMQQKLQQFGNLDYTKAVGMKMTSRAASSMGGGADFGAIVELDDNLSVGASIINPIVVWPGTEQVTNGTYDGKNFVWTSAGGTKPINFTDTEPMALSLGASYHLPLGFNLMGDLQQSFQNDVTTGKLYGPSAQAGLEWNIFNFLYARVGARVGGKDPMYGAGAGLNLFLTKLDLAAGVDPAFRSASAAVSWGLGF